MNTDILGNHVVRPDEILVQLNSLTVLKTGEQVPTRKVLKVIMDCQGCKRPITDKREVAFARQTSMCFECCTGSALDFGHRWSCRSVLHENLETVKHHIRKYCGERVEFTTQPYYRNTSYVELHWSWYPEDAFIRIGYHVFRLLDDLTREEADEAFRVSIYEGWESLMRLTRPAYERRRSEREQAVRNPNHKYHIQGRGRRSRNLLVSDLADV